MIKINESISVQSRDNSPVSSGLYLFYKDITITKNSVNDSWFVNILVLAFESVTYAVRVKYNIENAISLSEDKIKLNYHFDMTNAELENNSILSLIDIKIKAELDKKITPTNVVII